MEYTIKVLGVIVVFIWIGFLVLMFFGTLRKEWKAKAGICTRLFCTRLGEKYKGMDGYKRRCEYHGISEEQKEARRQAKYAKRREKFLHRHPENR